MRQWDIWTLVLFNCWKTLYIPHLCLLKDRKYYLSFGTFPWVLHVVPWKLWYVYCLKGWTLMPFKNCPSVYGQLLLNNLQSLKYKFWLPELKSENHFYFKFCIVCFHLSFFRFKKSSSPSWVDQIKENKQLGTLKKTNHMQPMTAEVAVFIEK